MGRERKLYRWILISATIVAASACCTIADEARTEVKVSFSGGTMSSKAYDPDEERISDISLMIFDESGAAEECIWMTGGSRECTARLILNKEYTFCACANFGRQIYADHIDELDEIRFHLAYPDEYLEGIPMYAHETIRVTGDDDIEIVLKRLMAKISLRMDRSMLSDNVIMNVRSVKIGNCPRSAKVFGASRAVSEDDCFPVGFTRGILETTPLNDNIGEGLSREIFLYMLENMQGKMDRHIYSDMDKVFDEGDPMEEICSFIELDIEYMSEEKYSGSKGLIYRFYLGEDRNSLDVERNCHYHITVVPEDDGLSEDSWRVDKSGLMDIGASAFAAYPANYIRGNIGEKVHIWCEFSPWFAPFDVGASYMEDDKAEGLYDYVIDEDGHGATLTLTGPGRGLIYMEAGEPVNDAALFIIEVNLP